MARHKEIPVIRVCEITPMMNFAYVRLSGNVERKPFVGKNDGKIDYLSFSINDGTGNLRVAAYDNVAREIVEMNLLPKEGVYVDVAGSLRVEADGRTKLYLGSSSLLSIVSPKGPMGAVSGFKSGESL